MGTVPVSPRTGRLLIKGGHAICRIAWDCSSQLLNRAGQVESYLLQPSHGLPFYLS